MIEFALTAPLLLLLIAGVLDYAVALRMAIAVSSAARAGAQYGSTTPSNSADLAGMVAAARNAAPSLPGLTAVAVQNCRCADGTAVSCTGACPSGPVQVYAEVTARTTAPKWFNYAGLSFTGAVSAKTVMRAQ
jgi:Flp pilus assembly protein TadG